MNDDFSLSASFSGTRHGTLRVHRNMLGEFQLAIGGYEFPSFTKKELEGIAKCIQATLSADEIAREGA